MHKSKYQLSATNVDVPEGEARLYHFSWLDEASISVLSHPEPELIRPYLRMHSECISGELFGTLDCDCREQLDLSRKIIMEKRGYLIYFHGHDGRGAGTILKLKAMNIMREKGCSTKTSFDLIGLDSDLRSYTRVSEVFEYFGIKACTVMTNNPRKIRALTEAGVEVLRAPLEIAPTEFNKEYLKSKVKELGHELSWVDR